MSIVQFPKRADDPLIWVCLCGCTTFRLFASGDAQCAGCDELARGEPEGWRARLPAPPAEPAPAEIDSFAVKNMDDADVFLKRQARSPAGIAAVVVMYADATVSTWQRGDALRQWIVDQLDHAKTRLIGDR